jgi:hypothetical protein
VVVGQFGIVRATAANGRWVDGLVADWDRPCAVESGAFLVG